MTNGRKEYTDNEILILIDQVNKICPICLKNLTYVKKGRIYKGFEIAHIYPCNPTKEEKELLKSEEILGNNPNDLDNVIPLCTYCHTKFDKPRTLEEYRYLLSLKKKAIQNQKIKSLYGTTDLTEEIAEIINELQNGEWDEISIQLKYNAVKIEQKLEFEFNRLLKKQIIDNVVTYYSLIKHFFSNVDKNNPGTFDLISGQIKVFYLQLNREVDDQEVIFEKMSEWIYLKTHNKGLLDACKIIISFFIQNCEIFENVTK